MSENCSEALALHLDMFGSAEISTRYRPILDKFGYQNWYGEGKNHLSLGLNVRQKSVNFSPALCTVFYLELKRVD